MIAIMITASLRPHVRSRTGFHYASDYAYLPIIDADEIGSFYEGAVRIVVREYSCGTPDEFDRLLAKVAPNDEPLGEANQ